MCDTYVHTSSDAWEHLNPCLSLLTLRGYKFSYALGHCYPSFMSQNNYMK